MTLNGAIAELAILHAHPMMPAFFKSSIEKVIETIYECEEKPQWIPCRERLPVEDGESLVLYNIRSRYKPYVYDVMSFANDLYQIDEYDFSDKKGQKGWFYCDRDYGYCEDNSVLAWMPLPEPYKGDGQE